tara:strand:+ start:1470 stop:1868 length:399 start_codon:yes stop_codon:yes gene_type:complete
MDILSNEQLQERAVNRVYSKQFFAINKLEEIRLEVEGVIPSKIGTDILKRNYSSQSHEVQVLKYLMDKLTFTQVTYDDTRDVAIRIVGKLLDTGLLKYNEDSYFKVQDIIQDEINEVLKLDIDDNFSININN